MTGLGAAAAIFLASAGSAVASAQGGMFAVRAAACGSQDSSCMGIIKPFVPIVIAGVLAIYGIIVAVLCSNQIQADTLTEQQGYKCFAAGLSVGLACLCSGFGMAKFVASYVDAHLHGSMTTTSSGAARADQVAPLLGGDRRPDVVSSDKPTPPIPVTWQFCMVLVFIEAIGLYGLIVALILQN